MMSISSAAAAGCVRGHQMLAVRQWAASSGLPRLRPSTSWAAAVVLVGAQKPQQKEGQHGMLRRSSVIGCVQRKADIFRPLASRTPVRGPRQDRSSVLMAAAYTTSAVRRATGSDKERLAPLTPSTSSTPLTPSTPSTPNTPATTAIPRENIYTLPNILTVARLATAPFIGYCILHDQPGLALSLLVAAGVSDLLDGWIARRWGLRTVVGSVLDPMADKVLMTVLAVSLAAEGGLPLWLAALVLGRDAGLGIAAIYYRWISLPPPKTLARYWDFSLPSAEVRPTLISKYNTFLQLALMAATMTAPVVAALPSPWDLTPVLTAMQYLVAVTTVWSGASYVYSKDAVRILSQSRGGKGAPK